MDKMFSDADGIPSWKKNPWFGELPINVWNKWPYMARWRGLSISRREEITEWVAENFRDPYKIDISSHHAMVTDPEFVIFMFKCMKINDLIHMKMRFFDIV